MARAIIIQNVKFPRADDEHFATLAFSAYVTHCMALARAMNLEHPTGKTIDEVETSALEFATTEWETMKPANRGAWLAVVRDVYASLATMAGAVTRECKVPPGTDGNPKR